jgi:hypothetical protein
MCIIVKYIYAKLQLCSFNDWPKKDQICSLKEIYATYKTPHPSILQGNTCILVDVYDREEGKGAEPVPAPLICYNPGTGWREKG